MTKISNKKNFFVKRYGYIKFKAFGIFIFFSLNFFRILLNYSNIFFPFNRFLKLFFSSKFRKKDLFVHVGIAYKHGSVYTWHGTAEPCDA